MLKNSLNNLMALLTERTVFLFDMPFSKRLLDSVLKPNSLDDFLIEVGLKTAASRNIEVVESVTDVSIPPITPAIAIGMFEHVMTVILLFR